MTQKRLNIDLIGDLFVREGINSLYEENEQLKQENKKLQGKYDHLLWLYNGLGCEYDWLKEENEQLKQSDNITDLETQIMKLKEENKNLKQALWEAEEEYLHEVYHDNPIRLQDKIINLKEDWDKEYWND